MRDFVNYFYAKKVEFDRLKKEQGGKLTSRQEDERTYIKLMLNSFYGKTAERVKMWQSDKIKAGKFFQPALASLITGKARETLARAVVKYASLYSDTDSIATCHKIDKKDIGSELGQLKIEKTGKMVIIRPKIYRVWDEHGEKIATHTFRDPNVLRRIFATPEKFYEGFAYQKTRLLRVKEASIRGLLPRAFLTQNFRVNFDADNKRVYHRDLRNLQDLMTKNTLSDPVPKAVMVKQTYAKAL